MNENNRPKALYKVRYRTDDHTGPLGYYEVVVDNFTQVKNMMELNRVIAVYVAVPVWAPLTGL